MTQSELTTWWQQQNFDFSSEKMEKLTLALELLQDTSLDLEVSHACISKNHLVELVKVLVELQADDEIITAALLFHKLRSNQKITEQKRQLFSPSFLFILDEIYKVS